MRRSLLLLATLAAGVAADAMPIGLRTATWGIAAANRRTAVDAVFPALGDMATTADVASALDGAADGALAGNITDAAAYAAFREWAKSAGAAAVKGSGMAWLSYALGADAPIGKAITSNDVRIVSFWVADGGSSGTAHPVSFVFEVAIDGVNIGEGAVAESVLKENLKKVLGIEGATTLTPGAFSSDNIDITFDAPVNGKARFTATRRMGDHASGHPGDSFFMRVKVK